MFNICKEAAPNSKLEGIIQDYIKANQECEIQFLQHVQQSENAFFNHWKALNAVRIQTQAQNWAKFMNELQQIASSPSNTITPNNTNHVFPVVNSAGGSAVTNSMASLSAKVNNALRQSRRLKAFEEYKCLRPDCSKVYTTKGNLNRHLKDYHHLNADLSPIAMNGEQQMDDSTNNEIKLESDECSDSESLKRHKKEILKHDIDISPPKKPTPPQTTASAVTVTNASNAFTIGESNHMLRNMLNHTQIKANHNPFAAQSTAQMMPKFPALLNMNNKNKALHLPVFNFNQNTNNLNAKLSSITNVNPFAISNTSNKYHAHTVLQVLANNLQNGNGSSSLAVDKNKNPSSHKSSTNVEQHGVNSFTAMPRFIKHDQAEAQKNKQRYAYNAIDILLQAAESLDKKKCDSVSSNTSSDTEDDRVRRTAAHYVSRKRRNKAMDDIDDDPTYDPEQDRNPAKRRKLNKEIMNEEVRARIDVDYKKGVCRLCKKTQREKNTSNYNWKNHLASDHKYPCTKCEDRFTKPKYLDKHIQKMHDDETTNKKSD